MHDTDDIPSNPTSNPHLIDLIDARLSRRTVIGGAMAAGVGVFLGGGLASGSSFAAPAAAAKRQGLLGFTEVPASDADSITVPPGYAWDVLIPWGTPLTSSTAAFAEDASNTSQDQEHQVGFNHDGMHYFPLTNAHKGSRRGLLVLNHEYTDASQIYSAAAGSAITPDDAGREKVAKAVAGHGVTVVEVVRGDDGTWQHVVDSPYNRRITGATPDGVLGPGRSRPSAARVRRHAVAARHAQQLRPRVHAVGHLPGVRGELERLLRHRRRDVDADPARGAVRGDAAGFGYNWHNAEPRFDLAVNRNELNRFGWVVEIDPFDPDSVAREAHRARSHQARGRGDHRSQGSDRGLHGRRRERRLRLQVRQQPGVAQAASERREPARRRRALRCGVRRRRQRHVGPARTRHGRAHGRQRLGRSGRRADPHPAGGRRGRRHPLSPPGVDHRASAHRRRLRHVHERHRQLGAGQQRPRPQPVRAHRPHPGRAATTPRPTFSWDIFLIAGDPAYDATVPADQPLFGSPDGIWVDPDGRVWIQTDISNSSQNLASRGYDRIKNNAMLAADPKTGELRRFLTGPRGLRDHRRHHDARSAHDVRQRPAPGRVDDVLEQPVRRAQCRRTLRRSALGRSAGVPARRRW